MLEFYWANIPVGKQNAVTYETLCTVWGRDQRTVRSILHELSLFDNGDDFILIRSGKSKGFYRTDNPAEIASYRKECLNKGRSFFAPVKKCNRILKTDAVQYNIFNNLRVVRASRGMKQKTVCKMMKQIDRSFDTAMLSKMENGVCLPTPYQLTKLSRIYGCEQSELVRADLPEYGDSVQI